MLFNFKKYTANNPLLREDGDNVTAADNAAYGADQEAGEPFEEEVTVSSSGVEMHLERKGFHLENHQKLCFVADSEQIEVRDYPKKHEPLKPTSHS